MAVTAQEVYDRCCFDLAEDPPGGLRLGLVTQSQFLDLLSLSILDFAKRSGLFKRIWSQTVLAGIGVYGIPDDIISIDSVFLAGRWLPPSTQRQLNDQIRGWRIGQAMPRFYYTDGLGLKSIGLAPTPNYNGEHIIGPVEPDPPFAVYDSFSALCQVGDTQVVLTPVQHRGLSFIGTQKPTTQVTALGDPIPLIPDDFAIQTLPFMVLERIFSSDGELLDSQRAAFCRAQSEEAISCCQAVSGETEPQER
jgi:hypothetical protein